MKCQSCGENNAVVHFTKIVNGKMEESHLCERCAKKENDWGFNMPFSFNNLFGGFGGFGDFGGLVDFNTEGKKTKSTCPNCGMSYRKILSIGKFGCPECYSAFEGEISSLLRSIHGHDKHIGKIPNNSSKRLKKQRKIEEYRIKLDNAILAEEFEAAAEYRDKIKELEEMVDLIKRKEDGSLSDVSNIDEKLEEIEKDVDFTDLAGNENNQPKIDGEDSENGQDDSLDGNDSKE